MSARRTAPVAEQEFTVRIYTDDLKKLILERVALSVEQQFETCIKDVVSVAVDAKVKQYAEKEIKAAVAQVLKDGWSRTNEYGESRGVASLKDRIGEMLNAKKHYGAREPWLDELVKTETQAALKGELAAEIAAAREKLRAEVDQVTRAKLNEALRHALGVQA